MERNSWKEISSDISDVRYINNEYHITGYQNFIIKNA